MIKKWYDEEGMVWAMLVSDGASEDVLGLLLGPPSLEAMQLGPVKEKLLREKLVEHGLYNAPFLMGQRPLLFEIFAEVGIPGERLRHLISIFQIDYDGDGENG